MSRCFPYPPPGYYRNGATAHDALIESIKLQKKTDKTKSERKKEKKDKKEKKVKRQKEKRNNEVSHKVWQNSANCTDPQSKGTNASTEVLDKSDLTQEHGQPISSHQPSYSSDSTQNSNKRKRDEYSLLPDSSAGNGSFKIRFLKKQKGSDYSGYVAGARSNTYTSMASFNSDRSMVSSIGNNSVPTTTGKENRTQTQTKLDSTFKGTKISDSNRPHFSKVQCVPALAKPAFQSAEPQQQVISRTRIEHEIPSYRGVSNLVINKTSTSAAGRPPVNEIPVPVITKQKEDLQKVGPTRSEKKMLKKHAKYEKLIGSWLPPVYQAELPDDDWLSSSKAPRSVLKVDAETCRESVASWQPCARFIAEVDIHALPYTVPF
ncbi:hypothetical protein Hdeb2414_s0025g00657821 [Helianthus debilis subsp. tardiflorus]